MEVAVSTVRFFVAEVAVDMSIQSLNITEVGFTSWVEAGVPLAVVQVGFMVKEFPRPSTN